MRAKQLAIEPRVGGEEGTTDPQQDATGMVWPRELGPVPDRLVSFVSGQLAGHLDRFPAHTTADREALGFAFAEGHPHRFPAAELTSSTRPLREGQEEVVASSACAPANAPSAVAQTITGRPTAATSACSRSRSTSARMLPPKPAPMMRAP